MALPVAAPCLYKELGTVDRADEHEPPMRLQGALRAATAVAAGHEPHEPPADEPLRAVLSP